MPIDTPELSGLERRVLVAVAVDGPQSLDRVAERVGTTAVAVGSAARHLVARGFAVRVPRLEGPPMLVPSTGGLSVVRDALAPHHHDAAPVADGPEPLVF